MRLAGLGAGERWGDSGMCWENQKTLKAQSSYATVATLVIVSSFDLVMIQVV